MRRRWRMKRGFVVLKEGSDLDHAPELSVGSSMQTGWALALCARLSQPNGKAARQAITISFARTSFYVDHGG